MVHGGIHHRHRDSIAVVLTQRVPHGRSVHEAIMAEGREVIMAGREAGAMEGEDEAGAKVDEAEARFAVVAVKEEDVSGEKRRVWPLTVMPTKRSGHVYSSIAH
jgi:hypothetical protein